MSRPTTYFPPSATFQLGYSFHYQLVSAYLILPPFEELEVAHKSFSLLLSDPKNHIKNLRLQPPVFQVAIWRYQIEGD